MKTTCATCTDLRQENTLLRDAVEELACKLAKAICKNPDTLRAGLPIWVRYIPENVKNLWKRGSVR